MRIFLDWKWTEAEASLFKKIWYYDTDVEELGQRDCPKLQKINVEAIDEFLQDLNYPLIRFWGLLTNGRVYEFVVVSCGDEYIIVPDYNRMDPHLLYNILAWRDGGWKTIEEDVDLLDGEPMLTINLYNDPDLIKVVDTNGNDVPPLPWAGTLRHPYKQNIFLVRKFYDEDDDPGYMLKPIEHIIERFNDHFADAIALETILEN